MTVPLDRLYNYLDALSNHDTIIYRFLPHGSRKIQDLTSLKDIVGDSKFHRAVKSAMVCHDQEPLLWSYLIDNMDQWLDKMLANESAEHPHLRTRFSQWKADMGIRAVLGNRSNIWDQVLLLHSEKNSADVALAQSQGCVPVYWWCHAVLARDWFRYAQLDPVLWQEPVVDKDFLIYNRAWSGSREYRLKFAELVLEHNLHKVSSIKFSPVCDNQHYTSHKFINPNLQIQRFDLEQLLEPNLFDSNASADYDAEDYAHHGIEIVLETLFDDARLFLTEKILRPIACGIPFICVGTAGTLQYLKDYGFETFSPGIDESYDTINDPMSRLSAIVTEMKRISELPQAQKNSLFHNLRKTAARNRALFFSDKWSQKIVSEFQENFASAKELMHPGMKYTNYFNDEYNVWPGTGELMAQQNMVYAWIRDLKRQ